jgi:hypothetical protein
MDDVNAGMPVGSKATGIDDAKAAGASMRTHTYIWEHKRVYVSSYYHICVLILLYLRTAEVPSAASAAQAAGDTRAAAAQAPADTPAAVTGQRTSAYVSIRQHTSAYVSIRQHTSAYVSIRQHTCC